MTDVTSLVVSLGNPVSGIAGYAKCIWDLQAYDGRIYYGAGNASSAGSTRNTDTYGGVLKYWNPTTQAFVSTGFDMGDQQIQFFRIIGGDLCIPGVDSRPSSSNENWAREVSGTWVQYTEVMLNSAHCFDVLDFGGQLFSTQGTAGTPSSIFQVASTGVGATVGSWANMSGPYANVFKGMSLFVANGKMYLTSAIVVSSGQPNAAIWVYTSGATTTAVQKSGSDVKLVDVFPTTHTGTAPYAYTDFEGNSQTVGTARIWRPTNFGTKVFYVGGDLANDHQLMPYINGLYSVTESGTPNAGIDTSTFVNITHPLTGTVTRPMPWDIWTDGSTIRVLWSYFSGSDVVVSVVESSNGSSWSEMFSFKPNNVGAGSQGQTQAFSYEFLDGVHYFGLGTTRWRNSDAAIQGNVGEILALSTIVTGTGALVSPSPSISSSGQGRPPVACSISTAARNAACDAIVDLVDAGTPPGLLKIYDATGGVPAITSAISTQVLLGTLTMSTTAFGSASTGVATAATITQDSSADATGTAAFFRITNAAGTAIIQGTCTATGGGGDLVLVTTSIVATQPIQITSLTFTVPAS